MCGRYASTRGRQELIDFFGVDGDEAGELEPDFNVAPTKPVPVVLTRRNGSDAASGVGGEERATRAASEERTRPENVRELHVARWGLVPSWAKDVSIGARLINARVETAHEKPAFRRAFASRRCLVPADGYYEWQAGDDGGKQPHFIHPADGGVLAMAGLYEVWRSADVPGGRLLTCTVITTEATDDVGRIHDRMPMLVEPDRFAAWLDPALNHPDEVRSLLVPAAAGRLESHPVSTAVNKVINNGPELVKPAPQMGIPSAAPLTLF
ncbi:MAG TPA: SOS response-associated peptidase [Actinoallomurus sp.]|jgi:putative SOS response-associated peptidase YedK